MVQVDVFWTYAIGAGFAAAAGRQLRELARGGASPFSSTYFVRTLLFLSILFVPSGVCLLWAFPGWETMFVGDRNLPAWLVTLFCATNITQGILGFWVAYKLIEKDHMYLAYLQIVFGYLAMFFILIHGWDGTGWRRFFYPGTIEQWRAGVHFPLYSFVYSNVAITLYLFGLLMVPIMLYWPCSWILQGYRTLGWDRAPASLESPAAVIRLLVRIFFVIPLVSALVASILIRLLGWVGGTAAFLAFFYLAGIRKGGIIHTTIGKITMESNGSSASFLVTHEPQHPISHHGKGYGA